jgi:hypothetical protein
MYAKQPASEKGHGRIETREVRIVTDIDWLENSETRVFLRICGRI